MPVTAKLSRKFYERLGDDIAGELVDWFNAVDSTYQAQLREINELNLELFKAQLHAQGMELRAEMRIQGMEFRAEMRAQNAELRKELGADLSAFETKMMKWMFIYWSGTMLPLAAIVLAMLKR